MPRRIPPGRFQELIEAATRVFIAQGYRRTQMADVAAAMGVAKGTLYLYVESKGALFDAVLRYADAPTPLPERLPIPTPSPATTLQEVEKRVAEEGTLPALTAALERRRVHDARGELEAIVRELYAVLARHRTGIKLLDRCAYDQPELAAVWYRAGREGAVGLLTRYLEERARRQHLRAFEDAAVAARILLETAVFWAVHHHWDPSPQAVDDRLAEDTVVQFILSAFMKE
jgi:AcrR family transcriptional regulator